tara:strand:+ start:773 stop:1300 length:528 start_codon:yes stop_codon:yes gene_type:complete
MKRNRFFPVVLRSLVLILAFIIFTGGRPVFHEITLEQLIQQSDAILIVSGKEPFQTKSECFISDYFLIEEVLFSTDKLKLLQPGKELIVNNRGLASHFDCEARKNNPSGVSFAANRYYQLSPTTLNSLEKPIIFIKISGKGSAQDLPEVSFTHDWAFEDSKHKELVVDKIKIRHR